MPSLKLFAIPFCACAGLFAWQMAATNTIKLPAPFHTPSANNRPNVVGRPDGAQLSLPKGFQIEEYASGFERPRYMIDGPSGELLLTDSTNQGSVYVFKTKDSRKKLLSGLDRPFGMAFWKDYLYVAETTSLKRYKYDKAAQTAGAAEEIYSMKEFGAGHWTRTIAFDAKGEKLYLGIGSRSNVDAGEPKERAAILSMTPNGKNVELFAEGTRNPTSIHFHPTTGQLWAAVQERDGLGDDLVPDYFTSIRKGGFYGWPFAYIGPNEDPRRKDEKPDLVKKTIVPDHVLGAHVAVVDWTFYTGKQFPAEYQGGAFLALHGSWNRAQRIGYSVAFIPMKNGKLAGPQRDFLSGWMMGPDKREVWGRPVAVHQLADGSLLVTDDGGNKIWRIFYKG
jgi:glucose/arabinose dehydrogenase